MGADGTIIGKVRGPYGLMSSLTGGDCACVCLPGEQMPLSYGWFATSFFKSLTPPQTDIECTRRGSLQSCMYISDLTESWDFSTRHPLPSGVRGWHNGSSETESENMVQSE